MPKITELPPVDPAVREKFRRDFLDLAEREGGLNFQNQTLAEMLESYGPGSPGLLNAEIRALNIASLAASGAATVAQIRLLTHPLSLRMNEPRELRAEFATLLGECVDIARTLTEVFDTTMKSVGPSLNIPLMAVEMAESIASIEPDEDKARAETFHGKAVRGVWFDNCVETASLHLARIEAQNELTKPLHSALAAVADRILPATWALATESEPFMDSLREAGDICASINEHAAALAKAFHSESIGAIPGFTRQVSESVFVLQYVMARVVGAVLEKSKLPFRPGIIVVGQ